MIPWKNTLAEMDRRIPNASPLDKQIGAAIRDELASAGPVYDLAFGGSNPPRVATTMIESVEHQRWRTTVTRDLDQIARLADGDPASSPNPNAALQRLRNARKPGIPVDVLRLIDEALKVGTPPEPRMYVDWYYRTVPPAPPKPPKFDANGLRVLEPRAPVGVAYGKIEQALSDALAAGKRWLEVA